MKLAYVEPTIEVKRYEISDVISFGSGNSTQSASDLQSVDDLVNDQIYNSRGACSGIACNGRSFRICR